MKQMIIFFTALTLLLTSCAFCTEEELSVSLPSVEGAKEALVLWTDGANCEHEKHIDLCAGGGQVLSVTVSKNACTPVLVYYYASLAEKLSSPYGLIYPHTTELSQRDGFAAEILRSLYAGSRASEPVAVQDYLARFNWMRFMELCRTYEDPWILNREMILEGIASGTFKKSSMQPLEKQIE